MAYPTTAHRAAIGARYRLAAVMLASLLTGTCGDATGPETGPPRIVFAYSPANDITQMDLYVSSEDGRIVRPLLRREGSEWDAAWSPDGRRVAFTDLSLTTFDREIFVVRADGSGLMQLTDGAGQTAGPAWSPDGSRIAAYHSSGSGRGIAIIGADGSGLTLVPGTEGAHVGAAPAWSPDGSKLAFGRLAVVNGNWTSQILTIGVDGSNPTIVATGCASVPEWSPDGTKIAFAACNAIGVVDADGSNRREVTSGDGDSWPSWSPDGRQIVFHSRREGALDLFVVTLDDGRVTNLTRTPDPQFEWQPDWKRAP